jgi:hypothetical protein
MTVAPSNTSENTDKFMDFISGKEGVDIQDFILKLKEENAVYTLLYIALSFDGFHNFSSKVVRAIVFNDLETIRLDNAFQYVFKAHQLLEYLEKNNATPKELLRCKILKTHKKDQEVFTVINKNRKLFRQIVNTIKGYSLQGVFESFKNAKKIGDLDIYFDEYLTEDETKKKEWKEGLEHYLLEMDKDTFNKILDAYPRKAEVIAYARSAEKGYTNKFLEFIGEPPLEPKKN